MTTYTFKVTVPELDIDQQIYQVTSDLDISEMIPLVLSYISLKLSFIPELDVFLELLSKVKIPSP